MDKLKLLIIDDDKVDRLNYRNLLTDTISFLVEIIEADDGKNGIQLWKDNKVDCVLLDYNLPDMNGLELINKYKEMGCNGTPIIMLTGVDNAKTIVAAMKGGVTDYIIKNEINTAVLLKTIQNAITQVKLQNQIELNRELAEQRKIAEEEHRIKYEFLSNMSHELRTPLTKIIGFAQLLQNEVLGKVNTEQNAALIKLSASADYLLAMINNAIEILAIDSGRFILVPRDFCLSEVIDEVVKTMSSRAQEKHIKITSTCDKTIVTICIDPERFKYVLNHFLENALKFTADGGYINIRVKADTPETFRLEVEDNGIGIESKDLGSLFHTFKPLDESATKKYMGTGLGLALLKRIVEIQGGQVNVSSTLGKGSVFSASFPRKHQQLRDYVGESELTVSE